MHLNLIPSSIFISSALLATTLTAVFLPPAQAGFNTDFIQRLIAELPVTVLIIWLIIKLNTQHRENVTTIIQTFVQMHLASQSAHQQQFDRLLQIIAKNQP